MKKNKINISIEEYTRLKDIEDFFKANIKCFETIQTLSDYGLFDEEEKAAHEHNLLFKNINMMRNELFVQ